MLFTKYIPMDYLIKSENSLHLTCYINNSGGPVQLKKQLRQAIQEFKNALDGVALPGEIENLLAPLEDLYTSSVIFNSIKGSVGIFRNKDKSIMLELPYEVENINITATSFHVKPLLLWEQAKKRYFILGLEESIAHLYYVNGSDYIEVGSMSFVDLLDNLGDASTFKSSLSQAISDRRNEIMDSVNKWLQEHLLRNNIDLYVTGENHLRKRFLWRCTYSKAYEVEYFERFKAKMTGSVVNWIDGHNKKIQRADITKIKYDYKRAKNANKTISNIFEIAKSAASGEVGKLLIAKEKNIFGKLKKDCGSLVIHYSQLDHQDDDLLDDLAQLVLAKGGQVVILPEDEMPKNEPVIAILHDEVVPQSLLYVS